MPLHLRSFQLSWYCSVELLLLRPPGAALHKYKDNNKFTCYSGSPVEIWVFCQSVWLRGRRIRVSVKPSWLKWEITILFWLRKPQTSFSPPVLCIPSVMRALISFNPSMACLCSFSPCVHCKWRSKQRNGEYWAETVFVEQSLYLYNSIVNMRVLRNPPAVP